MQFPPFFLLHLLLRSHGAPLIQPWGRDTFRVRLAQGAGTPVELPTALLPAPPGSAPLAPAASYSNGNLLLAVDAGAYVFSRVSDGKPLLTLTATTFNTPLPYHTLPSLTVNFTLGGATVFGLGQQRQACYPEGGAQAAPLGHVFAPGAAYTISLARGEGGAANTIPWLLGAVPGAGAVWGLWLNVPAMGGATFDATGAARVASFSFAAAAQLDFLVTTTPANGVAEASFFDVLQNFVSWVGAHPRLPDWALGYWHSKNRYASQAELLDAARGFYNRSIPVDYVIIDWLHWKVQGDWAFNPTLWPDPSAMVQELAAMGMRAMVTVWPWSHNGSLTYDALLAGGHFVKAIRGTATPAPGRCPPGELCPPGVVTMPDGLHGSLVDATSPAARDFVWARVVDGYVKHGIFAFWLDSTEPENFNFPQWGQVHWQNATYGAAGFAEGGTAAEMGQMFTSYWSQMFADGLRALGAPPVLLARASYPGTMRNGAALWSGDIHCSFSVLQTQVRTGLSAQASGFGLWTTDVGGFTDGEPDSPPRCDPNNATYRELWVRWFQYGVVCPLFRQHGSRATEVWAYGPEAEAIVTGLIRWRASMRSYIGGEMDKLSATGRPINRGLWWDFPLDPRAWTIDDQFMFGDAYLAAPVLEAGAVFRDVYLPEGAWTHVFSNETFAGGQMVRVEAPLDSFPLFQRV
jgi:alpha-D-xyloside xylohydrolase